MAVRGGNGGVPLHIWDVVKQNLLDKGSGLTLNAVTAELLSVSNCIERERQLDESEKKQKADQLCQTS